MDPMKPSLACPWIKAGMVRLPYRDVERRIVLGLMLGLDKRGRKKLTIEEMERIALERGLLRRDGE
jgi:hypothetical protein